MGLNTETEIKRGAAAPRFSAAARVQGAMLDALLRRLGASAGRTFVAAATLLLATLVASLFGRRPASARAALIGLPVAVAHAASPARFFGSEFVGSTFLVRRLAALAGDFTLALRVH